MEPIKILIIEDDEDYAFLEKDILSDELDCTINIVCSKESLKAKDILESDIVLLDFNLPDITGDEILEIIREKIDIPVIIITGDEQLQIAVKTFKHGATDFLIKSPQNIALLPQIVKRILNEYKNMKLLEEERKEKEALNIKIETLRQVLTTLAHYINNSTTTIYGYAQLCEQEPGNVRRSKKLAKISIKETEKITFVLQELEKVVNTMEVKTTKYVNIPDAMFAIEENIKKKMEELKKSLT